VDKVVPFGATLSQDEMVVTKEKVGDWVVVPWESVAVTYQKYEPYKKKEKMK